MNEYLMQFHPTDLQWKRVRLGPVANPEEAAMMSVIQRWADAITFDGETITIIEAKIRPEPGVVGQLEMYDDLFTQTPEFQMYWEKPRELLILSGVDDQMTRNFAQDKGMTFQIYQPKWLAEYMFQRYGVRI